MRMEFELNMRQEQKLIMTTELRLAISLLQLNSLDLVDYLKNEMLENPMLEFSEQEKSAEREESLEDEVDWQVIAERFDDSFYRERAEAEERDEYNIEAFTSYEITLYEYLMEQWRLYKLDERVISLGADIIEYIDENGYLNTSTEFIARRLKVDEKEVLNALYLIQTLDPLGVGARDLRECLRLQAEASPLYSEELIEVIQYHLEDLAKNRISKIASEVGISVEFTQEISDIIKTFDPKPGAQFGRRLRDTRYIVPDAYIEFKNGRYEVTVNESNVPKLNINRYYRKILKDGKDKAAVEFLTGRFQKALWIIKAIDERKSTIENVLNAIVERQTDFLNYGIKYLRPMTLREVAEDLGIHESTVSRATSGKYVQTPRGLFELKYFFTSSLSSMAGNISSAAVKDEIRRMVDEENKQKPLSDQTISNMLSGKGIKISRRTVAKYRDELDIPSTVQRRRFDG